MNTKRKKHLFSALAFGIGLLLMVYLIVVTLRPKRDDGYLQMYNYYGQDAGTVDVVLLGTSQVGCAAAAQLLWQEQGISAYNLWSGGQSFWESYHRLIEVFKYQKPKVVVLDARAAIQEGNYTSTYYRIGNAQSMKWSRNKIAEIMDAAPREDWLDIFLELPLTHGVYGELTAEDFQYYFGNHDANNKGDMDQSYKICKASPLNMEALASVKYVDDISEKTQAFFRKIIELCQAQEVPLLLVSMPAPTPFAYQPKYNRVAQIAGEYGLPYLNYNLIECGFDPLTGYMDTTHMNMSGARTVMKHLGSYLKETYALPDHRGDPAYESWDTYVHRKAAGYLKKITDLQGYVDELDASTSHSGAYYGYQYYITEYNRCDRWDEADIRFVQENLLRMGLDINTGEDLIFNSWAFDSRGQSAMQYVAYEDAKSGKGLDLNGVHYETDTKTWEVKVNGTVVGKITGAGIMIIVYDPYLQEVVDAVEFLDLLSYSAWHKL